MISIDLAGRHALVLGVANHRSIVWAIARQLHAAGAALCMTYANDRMRPRDRKSTRLNSSHG